MVNKHLPSLSAISLKALGIGCFILRAGFACRFVLKALSFIDLLSNLSRNSNAIYASIARDSCFSINVCAKKVSFFYTVYTGCIKKADPFKFYIAY